MLTSSSWVIFSLGQHDLGLMPLAHAMRVAALLPDACWTSALDMAPHLPGAHLLPPGASIDRRLRWVPADASPAACSLRMAEVAGQLRLQGFIRAWRDELYPVEQPQADPCQGRSASTLMVLERAAFRFFGFLSRAVHVHGETSTGEVWVGRRAQNKATDPGLLDNLAAGGWAVHETLMACAQRELLEEAGVGADLSCQLRWMGTVRSTHSLELGLHDEVLHMARLTVPEGFVPRNQDGEVQRFERLTPAECLHRLACGEFTSDAGWVTRLALACAEERRTSGGE